MHKKLIKIIIILLAFTAIVLGTKETRAFDNTFDTNIWFGINGSKGQIDRDVFEEAYDAERDEYLISLYFKSNHKDRDLGYLQGTTNILEMFEITYIDPQIGYDDRRFIPAHEFDITEKALVLKPVDSVLNSKPELYNMRANEDVNIVDIFLRPISPLPDSFNITLDLTRSGAPVTDSYTFKTLGMQVGDPDAGPSANLKSLSVDGVTDNYLSLDKEALEAGETEFTIETNPVSYQDSINNRLEITYDPVKSGATHYIVGIKDDYNDGDKVIITVTDPDPAGPVTKKYIINIKVTSANTVNTIEISTNKGSGNQVDITRDGVVFTVSVPYSMNDITVYGRAIHDLAKIDKVEQKFTSITIDGNDGPSQTTTFTVTAEDGTPETYTVKVVKRDGDADTTLKYLDFDGERFENPSGDDFIRVLPEDRNKFEFFAVATKSTSKVEFKLSKDTDYKLLTTKHVHNLINKGETVIYDIRVTSENGTSLVYKLNVTREKSSNTNLKGLYVTESDQVEKVLKADGRTYKYTIVNPNAASLNVRVELQENQGFKITDEDGMEVNMPITIKNLKYGVNNFVVTILPENGDEGTPYYLEIQKSDIAHEVLDIKVDNERNETVLKSIGDFENNGTHYEATLEYADANSLNIGVSTSERSTIDNNNSNYELFQRTFTSKDATSVSVSFTVYAQDRDHRDVYTITIYRGGADKVNSLAELHIDGVKLADFNGAVLVVPKTQLFDRTRDSISVYGIPTSDKAVVSYFVSGINRPNGQIGLTAGKKTEVLIRVTAQNGEFVEYRVNLLAAEQLNEITNITLTNISETLFKFDADVTEYNFDIPFTISGTTAKITTNAKHATEFGATSYIFKSGEVTTITLYLKSEAQVAEGTGEGTRYTINITSAYARDYKKLATLSVYINGVETKLIPGSTDFEFSIRVDSDVLEARVLGTVLGTNGERIQGGKDNLTFDSNKNLIEGLAPNTFTITVLAEDGSIEVYKVHITRANDVNTFDSVVINDVVYTLKDHFVNNILTLPKSNFSVTEVSYLLNLTDPKSTVVYNEGTLINGNKTWLLSSTNNKIRFIVKSQADSDSAEYTIILDKEGASKENKLADISILVQYDNGTKDLITADMRNTIDTIFVYNKLRVDRIITSIQVIAKVLTSDQSEVLNMGAGVPNDIHRVYTKSFNVTGGIINPIIVSVKAEDTNVVNTDYTFNILVKDADNEITNVRMSAGGVEYYNGDFADKTLDKSIPHNINKLLVEVTRVNKHARVAIDGKSATSTEEKVTYEVDLITGVNQSFTIKSETEVTLAESDDYVISEITITYNKDMANTDAVLSSLKVIVDGTDLLAGKFNTATTSYMGNRVDRKGVTTTVKIEATADLGGRVISGTGSFDMQDGTSRIFVVEVEAQDGSRQRYEAEVIIKNASIEITKVKITGGGVTYHDGDFVSKDLGDIPFNVNELLVEITKVDQYARVLIDGVITPLTKTVQIRVNLHDGSNDFDIKIETDITPEERTDHKEAIETISYTKLAASDIAELATLEFYVDGTNLLDGKFDGSLAYLNNRVDRKGGVHNIEIKATAKNNGIVNNVTTTQIDGIEFTYTITVTSEDRSKSVNYTIQLFTKNDNSIITNIEVENIDFDFNLTKDDKTYLLPEQKFDVKQLEFKIDVEDSYAVIVVNGKEYKTGNQILFDLKDEMNTITVYAKSEMGTVGQKYIIKVNRVKAYTETKLDKLLVYELIAGVEGDVILFDGNQYVDTQSEYIITLPVTNTINTVKVDAQLKDPRQVITGDGLSNVFIGNGSITKTINFTVSAEAGTPTNYKITIVRGDAKSDDIGVAEVTLLDNVFINYLEGDNEFKIDKETYNIVVPFSVETLSLNVVTDHDKARVVYTSRNVNLRANPTATMTFKVIAEDLTESPVYTFNISKEVADNDATLLEINIVDINGIEILGLADKTPLHIFDSNTRGYNILLDRSFEEIDIIPTSNSSKATITGDYGNYTLTAGQVNTFRIRVQAEDPKISMTYTINITVKNDDIEVLDILVDGKDIGFVNSQPTYTLDTVTNDVTTINISVEISDPFGILDGDGIKSLNPGVNTFIITAKSEDAKKVLTYTIIIEREASTGGGGDLNNDNTLTNLFVETASKPYNLGFSEATKEYTVTIDFIDTYFVIKGEFPNSATIIGGNVPVMIKSGETKTVTVYVIAQNGDIGDSYKVTVTRETGSDENIPLELYVVVEGTREDLLIDSLSHTVTVSPDVQGITIGAVIPAKATITGDGNHVFLDGTNEYSYVVAITSETGIARIYTVNVKRVSDDASLESLKVSNNKNGEVLTLSPVFSSGIFAYNIDLTGVLDITTIMIEATTTTKVKSIEGTGVHTLKSGDGMTTDRYVIKVTAEDGVTTLSYVLTITRNVDPEDSVIIDTLDLIGEGTNYLSNEQDKGLNQFNPDNTSYTITVPYALKSIFLSVTNNNGATITGAGDYQITNQETIITFFLVSKSGRVTSDTYTIKLVKEEASDDATLIDIKIDGKTIDGFKSNVYTYTLKMVYEQGLTINVQAFASNEFAIISGNIGNVTLINGTNNILIKVVSETGSEQYYNIVIEALNNDNEILNITVEGYTLDPIFNKEQTNYRLNVAYNVSVATINVLASNKSTVVGAGVKTLEEGINTFIIYAVSEYGFTGKSYTVVIHREGISSDASLKNLTVKENSKDGKIIEFLPEFNPLIHSYVINLPKGSPIKNVFIEAEVNNQYAIVGGIGFKVLKGTVDGEYQNVFEVVVRAQDGSTLTYTITVYRNVELSGEVIPDTFELIGNDGVNYLGTDNQVENPFSFDKFNYEIQVPFTVKSLSALITAEVGNAYGSMTKIFGDHKKLEYEVGIVSQDGSNKVTYKITVTKEDAVIDNDLIEITINNALIAGFDPLITDYEINLPLMQEDEINIGAKLAAGSNSSISGDLGTVKLKVGRNVFKINVHAEDGSVNVYTITVNYVDVNALLEELNIKDTTTDEKIDFVFKADQLVYNITISASIKEVMVTGVAQDVDHAKIRGQGRYKVSQEGVSSIYLYVTAADGVTEIRYVINLSTDNTLSSNTYLKSLTIEGYTINFSRESLEYNLSISGGTNRLNINAVPEVLSSNVEILNSDNLKAGQNVVIIRVTAEDGTVGYYHINAQKEGEPNMFLTVLLILSLLLWIILVLVILVRQTRKKNDHHDDLIY